MDDAVLTTDRLVLRPPADGHLAWILAEMNTVAVMRYLGGVVRAPEVVRAEFNADIESFGQLTGHRRWTVWRRADNRRIGRCGLFRVRTEAAPAFLRGQTEIGWTLAEANWGQGFATEAARAVIAFAFDTVGSTIIYAQTSDSNLPSTRMMVRLGFVARPELGYFDPDYPPEDSPTTVWSSCSAD